MRGKSKIIAVVLVLMFIISLSFFNEYIIENAHHHCPDEDCQVCISLDEALQFISNIKLISNLPFVMAVLYMCIFLYTVNVYLSGVKNTLVSWKVKLLN